MTKKENKYIDADKLIAEIKRLDKENKELLKSGVVGYIIEDELGHYDCIIHPDEVLGGGYGIKSNGSPYPTKEANFGQPHWKPSDVQMEALAWYSGNSGVPPTGDKAIKSLYNDLKKL